MAKLENKVERYDPWERVPVRLYRDSYEHSGDLFVCVNGRDFLIRRGETVYVPACVAKVLELSEAQDDMTARRIRRLTER